MSAKQVLVGIVGLGRAGWHLHLEPMLKHGGYKIVAVSDPDAARCKEATELTGCEAFSSIDAMLAATDATLVVVATPSASHYADALKVLKSGRDCLLEKPMAMNAAEADELVEAAKSTGKQVFVHHQHLFNPEYSHFKEVIESGILGPLFHFRAFWGGYARRWDWQCLKKNGGGQLNNTFPHLFSIVLPLLGANVASVTCDMRNIKDAGDAEDHVDVSLRAQNGVTADLVVSSAVALGAPKWLIYGKYGALECDGKVSRLRYYDPSAVNKLEVVDTAAPGRKYLTETLPWQEETRELPERDMESTFHHNVYEVLANGAESVVSAQSAAEVIRVLSMARESSEQGTSVQR